MFSLFKKKQAQSEPPLKKKIKDMKCRKINYVDEGFDTLASEMSADPKAILRLKPVNYYAIKNKYIMGKVYTSEDLSLIHISEPTRQAALSRMPSSA